LCGAVQVFSPARTRSIRDEYPCGKCSSPLRYRDQASAIIDEFGRGRALSLDQLVRLPSVATLDIYEVSLRGPFIRYFSRLPGYVRSYFWEALPLGEEQDGVRNEDLRSLTFASESFDLVITSDVLEHIFGYREAFEEIHRVLKPGGVHIFTVPTQWPLPERSVARARQEHGQTRALMEERYHTAGDGSRSLVVTDFGEDLFDELEYIGLRTIGVRRSMPLFPAHRVLTFVSRKHG
jgi:SAM-dependent methyltransferase